MALYGDPILRNVLTTTCTAAVLSAATLPVLAAGGSVTDADLFDLQHTLTRLQTAAPQQTLEARALLLQGKTAFAHNTQNKSAAAKLFFESLLSAPSVPGYAWAAEAYLLTSRSSLSKESCIAGKFAAAGRAAKAFRMALDLSSAIKEPLPEEIHEALVRERLACMAGYGKTPAISRCSSFYAKVAASC